MLKRIWAPWRSKYVSGLGDPDSDLVSTTGGGTLFEKLLAVDEPDEQIGILWRGETCFALLNAHPYGSGHLMVVPNRRVADLADLTPAESQELWATVMAAVAAIRQAYTPEGINVGINIGAAAGAGVPDHLHVHCLPRWQGDTNFTTTVAEARVLPEPLSESWAKLKNAWPEQ
ncbi:MAG: HIT domain-containing protein [Acidimicrobiia bacterium]|nr:HIT domain-containing protein [Acidimicrobiia bacterium]MYC57299.1 HIT domain-containing protein [Acidimicrobiia bacterium]MYG94502.1 HIT domain-containing protein [Acidimicrobiia bacterium]MYI31000.1 HIT domain-containing protein [Acidimicrobiia bacterium]